MNLFWRFPPDANKNGIQYVGIEDFLLDESLISR